MGDRIQDFFEKRPGSRLLLVIAMVLVVRVLMIVTTDSRYYAMFERELTRRIFILVIVGIRMS